MRHDEALRVLAVGGELELGPELDAHLGEAALGVGHVLAAAHRARVDRLLEPVAFTGLKMPLCCENIFAPLVPRPDKPEGVDDLARRARLYLETVIAGLQV